MKKFLIAVLTLILVAAVTCCVTIPADAAQDRPLKIWPQNENGRFMTLVVVDEDTGVNYVVVNFYAPNGSGLAISPRYNADGSLYITP